MKKVIRLTESDLIRLVKRVIKERNEEVGENDYKNAFNTIIKPWMENMDKKWFSQGFTCEIVSNREPGMSKCDNRLYGFKRLDETHNQYSFPYELGINLYMFVGDSGSYFQVFHGETRRSIGTYGKDAKNQKDVNKAANDAINAFNHYAGGAWSYAYPT